MVVAMDYRWYAIQTTAGHENKVRGLLAKRIEDDPRAPDEKLVRQALVPVQDVIEIKNGKKVTVERKLYPGYVLVEMQNKIFVIYLSFICHFLSSFGIYCHLFVFFFIV